MVMFLMSQLKQWFVIMGGVTFVKVNIVFCGSELIDNSEENSSLTEKF